MKDFTNKKNIKELFIESLIFGIVFTFCFYNNVTGIACVIFNTVIMLIIYRKIYTKLGKVSGMSIFYGVCMSLISIIPAFSDNQFSNVIGRLIYLVLAIKWLIYINYNVTQLEFVRNIVSIINVLIKSIAEIVSPLADYFDYIKEENEDSSSGEKKTGILKGIILAVPVLIVVILLLASADAVFRNVVTYVFSGVENVITLIKIIFIFAGGFLICYSIGRNMMRKELVLKPVNINKTDSVVGITFTSIISVVYILFCGIQVIVLFTAGESMLPDGYTYAKYARQGFFQLMFVCVINVIMVILCKLKFSQTKILKILLGVISGCTYIMLISSAYRMIIYVQNYDLSSLRLLVLWFLALLAVTMAGVITFIFKENFDLFNWIMISSTVLFLLLAFVRPDRMIAEYNIRKMEDKFDTEYLLADLSNDAADIVIDNSDKLDEERVTEYCNNIVQNYESGDFRKYNYSRKKAYEKAVEYLK